MDDPRDVHTKVVGIIAEQMGVSVDNIRLDSSLVGDLGADSLDTPELVMLIEDEFGIYVDGPTEEKFETVQDIIDATKKIVYRFGS